MLNGDYSGNLKGALDIYTEMKEAHVKQTFQTYTILIRYAIPCELSQHVFEMRLDICSYDCQVVALITLHGGI